MAPESANKKIIVPGDVVRDFKIESVSSNGHSIFRVGRVPCVLRPSKSRNISKGDVLTKAVCLWILHNGTPYFAIDDWEGVDKIPICELDIQKERWSELAFDNDPVVSYDAQANGHRFLKPNKGNWEMVIPVSSYHHYVAGAEKMGPVTYIEKGKSFSTCYRDLNTGLPRKFTATLKMFSDDSSRPIGIVLHGFIDNKKLHYGTYCHLINDEVHRKSSKVATEVQRSIKNNIWRDCEIRCDKKICGYCPENRFKTVQEKIGSLTAAYQQIFCALLETALEDKKGEVLLVARTPDPTIKDNKDVELILLMDSTTVCDHTKPYIIAVFRGLLFEDEPYDGGIRALVAHLNPLTAYPVNFNELKPNGFELGRILDVRPIR